MKRLLLTLIAAASLAVAYAVSASPQAASCRQSDGTSITVQLLGDEWGHCYVTSDGYTIERRANGDFYYKTQHGPTNVMAHNPEQRTLDELNYINANEANLQMGTAIINKQRARYGVGSALRKVSRQVTVTGSPKIPVIVVGFKDFPLRNSNAKTLFEDKFNSTTSKSVRKYFTDQSYGKFSPQFDLLGPVTLPNTRAFYGANSGNVSDVKLGNVVYDAVTRLTGVNFSKYDNDNDGKVDAVVILYAGPGENTSGASDDAIWPASWSMYNAHRVGCSDYGPFTRDGKTIDSFACVNETQGPDDSIKDLEGIGTSVHEYSHLMGLPDYYDTGKPKTYVGMGNWSVMANGNHRDRGHTPAGYTAFEKECMGWFTIPTAVRGTRYTLNDNSASSNIAVKVVNPDASNEYFVLENIQQTGWNAAAPASGLMISHVTYDQDAWVGNDVNSTSLQRMTIFPADNQLSTSNFAGDLYPYSGNNSLTNTSAPPARVNLGRDYMDQPITGIVKSGGKVSFDFCASDISSGDLQFKILTEPSGSNYGTAEVVGLNSTGKGKSNLDLKIPASVSSGSKKYNVTRVQKLAFKDATNITSLTIEYGVKVVDESAFKGCTAMTYARFPSSITDINAYSFAGCTKLDYVYVAALNAKNISTYRNAFDGSSKRSLYLPWGADWASYRNRAVFVAANFPNIYSSSYSFDFYMSNGSMSIVTKPSTGTGVPHEVTVIGFNKNGSITGVSEGKFKLREIDDPIGYDRTIKYVAVADSAFAGNTILTEVDFSAARSMTKLGKSSFRGCTNLTSVKLSVDTISAFAFTNCSSLATAKWDDRLKRVEEQAFSDAPITNDLVFPVGFKYLGYKAFNGVKSTVLLVPSTFNSCSTYAFDGMKSLQTLIMNSTSAFSSDWTLYFTDVPTSCNVYVPVGLVDKAKGHNYWKRFTNIQAGAFDFGYDGNTNSRYTMTVTSTSPVTVGGVTYAGKAKYVYNPRVTAETSYACDNAEVDKMCGVEKKYLITELGDSLFYGANIKTFNFEKMANLERIGRKAFMNSQLESATMPNRKITFGVDAFYNATKLTELVIPGVKSWDGRFFGDNASDFLCYVDYSYLASNLQQLSTHNYSSSQKCSDRLAPCFTTSGTTFNLATLVPLDFEKSGNLKAYAVKGLGSSNNQVATTKWNYTENDDQGVILTELTPDQFYKVKRKNVNRTSTSTNYLRNNATANAVNIKNIDNAYYWDVATNKFIKPTGSYYVTSGRCYLLMPGATASELYLDILPPAVTGDVNGDGIVDVTDVNLAINVMLGKASKSTYPAADVNGDGTVDVTDVNLIINSMLGK